MCYEYEICVLLQISVTKSYICYEYTGFFSVRLAGTLQKCQIMLKMH